MSYADSSEDKQSLALPSPLLGTVIAIQANYYQVRLQVQNSQVLTPVPFLLCTRRSRLKKLGNR